MIGLSFAIFIVLTFALIEGLPVKWRKDTKPSFIFLFYSITLISFAAFRPIGIDQDSVGYREYYNSGDGIWLLAEPTFGLISNFVRYLCNDFRIVLIIYAILGVSIKFWAFKRISFNVWATILLYFSTYFLLHDFTQIRAGIASALFLVGIYFLSKEERGKYIIIILLAILFHYSAAILLPVVFIKVKQLNKLTVLLLSISIPLAIVISKFPFQALENIPIELLQRKSDIYQSQADNSVVHLNYFNLVYLTKYIIFYLMLWYNKVLTNKNQLFPLLLLLYGASLFMYIALSWNTILAMRLSELLGIVEILLIPIFVQIFKGKYIKKILVIAYSMTYLFINIFSLELIYKAVKL